MSKSKVNRYILSNSSKQEERIREGLLLLGLDGMGFSFVRLARSAMKNNATFHDFLENLVEQEMAWKEENRIANWTIQARFPWRKTIDDFDFSFQPSIDQKQIKELVSGRFIERAENIAFFGSPGVGKTHLAIAVGQEAISQGFDVRFITLGSLIDAIDKAIDGGARHRLLQTLLRPKLLILDEVDRYETNETVGIFLSKLLEQRYEKASVIFTSNQSFATWKSLFGNEARAAAIIDRMMHHAEVIYITGHSYRMKDKLRGK